MSPVNGTAQHANTLRLKLLLNGICVKNRSYFLLTDCAERGH